MKKTLSILLSLLMVLGTITCLFTMPVATASAEEAATEATTTVETLPVNDFITNNAVKTITPDSNVTIGGVEFPTSVNYGIRGWNDVQSDSYIDNNVYYQMTFDVTVSSDINDGVTFRPVFHSNASMNQGFAGIVGMRTDVTAPATVETAYNLKTNANSTAADLPSTTAENAATLVAGKTYTYTYVFNSYSGYINNIRMLAEGLTAGSVTVGEVKIFRRSETDANNFQFTTTVVSYAVEEDGNVFTRLYGYRDVGSTAAGHKTLSAKVGGDLYNMNIVGGKTYELRFDARYTSAYGFNDDDNTGRSPAFDLFETGALDYTEAYASIKDAADTKDYKKHASAATTSQRTYSGPNYGYSYFYANSGSETYNRRVKNEIATMSYYDANGTLLTRKSQGYGSQSGRNLKNEINTSTWIKGVYSLDAIGAQTLQEAAVAGSTSGNDAHMRYRYVNGAWVYNSAVNNIYVPAKQDATVALSIDFLQLGSVYDFDNFKLVSDVKDVPVEYIDANGNAVTTAYTSHPASSYFDATSGKTYATIKLFESDVYTFNGWYNGDEFISTDAEIALDGNYNNLKAVITTKNLLTNAGGFENYNANTSLETAYTELNTTNYPNYTGTANDQRRFYNARPIGDKWTGWDNSAKRSSIKDSDDGKTTADIINAIEAAGGVINDGGFTGFTWFKNFPQVVSAKDVTVYSDAGNYSGNSSKVPVTPYSGTKMLQMQPSSRTAYRAIEGLTPGKTYTLSFYAYNTYAYYFLKDVAVKTAPNNGINNHADSKQLAGYTTPYDIVDETYLNDKGTETSGSVQKANADYVGKWYNISLTFTAEDTVAYLALYNQNKGFTGGYTYIDELTLVEYDCNGNHLYDDLLDINCNVCGETRVYDTDWDFEDGNLENIYYTGDLVVKDAVDQPAKIGSKYLEYTTTGWNGITFNFPYEQGYKYKISYDFKIFAYGTGTTSNGIDHTLLKDADGSYGSPSGTTQAEAALNPATDNIVTRYYEDGTVYEKVECFNHSAATQPQNNYYGRKEVDGVYVDEMASSYGPAELWNGWQHFEIEVGTNNDYEGMVEYGIRPNDAGWVVGFDNFKVEKIATAAIDEANDATNGTYAFNIRAKTSEQKQGLRFKSTIDLDKLNLADGARIVEYGTLAAKASYADQGYFLRREAADAKNAKVVAGVAYNAEDGTDIRYAIDESTNTLTYTGVLTGIGVKNYDVDFIVRGYAIVEAADGTRTTVYDEAVTLSVYDAAQQIIETNTNADDVAIAQTVVDTYNAYLAAQ